MRTEHELRAALQLLVERTPDADDVLARFHVPAPPPRTARDRRPALVAGVVLVLVLLGALVVPPLVRPSHPEPADRRVPGNWAMVSHLEPPPGWSSRSLGVAGTYETSVISDATGKGVCWVEVDGARVVPQRAAPAGDVVTVAGRPGLYEAPPGRESAVFWRYSADAGASISCSPGPKGLGAARTPPEIRDVIIGLAESVTFGTYPLRVPVRIAALPAGYRVASVSQDVPARSTSWGITLGPVSSTTPVITLGASLGSVPEANTRVGPYPATFFTEPIFGPVTRVPRKEVSVTSLCLPSAPVGFCVSGTNTAADDPESRRDLFHDLAVQVTYASDASDTTWFDATDALPS